jgi:hypothetical protein
VPDLEREKTQWGWLLGELGYQQFQDWPAGHSWRLGATYLVIEQSPAMSAAEHDRLRPGLNHLAFHAGARQRVDALTTSVGSDQAVSTARGKNRTSRQATGSPPICAFHGPDPPW